MHPHKIGAFTNDGGKRRIARSAHSGRDSNPQKAILSSFCFSMKRSSRAAGPPVTGLALTGPSDLTWAVCLGVGLRTFGCGSVCVCVCVCACVRMCVCVCVCVIVRVRHSACVCECVVSGRPVS